MVNEIPRFLLPHSVTVKQKVGEDRWQGALYVEKEIENVRVEFKRGLVYGKDKKQTAYTAVMYVGGHSADFLGIEADDVVVYRGFEMTVKAAEEFFAFDGEKPHHWEVFLV
jgi:hypothetical protein